MADPTHRATLQDLVEVMDRLLAPGGCPWDQEQTHHSLRPFVLEEAYEVVAAIDEGRPERLQDELGDLLLQVVFHAALAERAGHFDVGDVVANIVEKLRRRHPHVFGDRGELTGAAVLRQWEDIKRQEAAARAQEGQTAGPIRCEAHLPALMQAQKLLERAARLGYRPTALAGSAPVVAPGAVTDEAGLGRALLGLLEAARQAGIDAELSLRAASADLARELHSRHSRAEPVGRPPSGN